MSSPQSLYTETVGSAGGLVFVVVVSPPLCPSEERRTPSGVLFRLRDGKEQTPAGVTDPGLVDLDGDLLDFPLVGGDFGDFGRELLAELLAFVFAGGEVESPTSSGQSELHLFPIEDLIGLLGRQLHDVGARVADREGPVPDSDGDHPTEQIDHGVPLHCGTFR